MERRARNRTPLLDGAARECAGQGLFGHPLVHLALVLVGDGDTWDQCLRVDGAGALAAAGLTLVVLGPKEGLALIEDHVSMSMHAAVRGEVPTLTDDRSPAPDIDAITKWIRDGQLE